MALTPDQQTYAHLVAQGTGLDQSVVNAWVAQENGPPDNVLNIGPGRHYGSVQAGADAAIALIRQAPAYAGIRNSISQPPIIQIAAISASPWDGKVHYANGANLVNTYNSQPGIGTKLSLQDVQVAMGGLGTVVPNTYPDQLNAQQAAQAQAAGLTGDSGCLWSLGSIGPFSLGCIISKSQGRALLGAVSMLGGGLLFVAGLALIAGREISLPKLGAAAATGGSSAAVTGLSSDDAQELAYRRGVAEEEDRIRAEQDRGPNDPRDRLQAQRELRAARRHGRVEAA